MQRIKTLKDKIQSLSAHPLVFAVLLLGLAIGATYATDKLAQVAGVGQMVEANNQYLKESLEKSGTAFVSLSAIKAGVAIIEGSTVGVQAGVTADLQVGDAVQSIFDFIDMAWKITFFSSATLFIVKSLLLQISALGLFVMLIAFVSGAVVLAVKNWKRKEGILLGILRRVFWFFLMCTVGIYIALPVSVGAARFLSDKITRPVVEEGLQAFEEMQAETSTASMNNRLFPEGEKIKDKLKLKEKIEDLALWCKELFGRLFEKGIRFCAGFLFDCLIFPGALLLTAWAVIKKGLSGRGVATRPLREDMVWALRKLKNEEPGE